MSNEVLKIHPEPTSTPGVGRKSTRFHITAPAVEPAPASAPAAAEIVPAPFFSIVHKTTLWMLLLLFIGLTGLTAFGYLIFRRHCLDNFANSAYNTAKAVAAVTNGDTLDRELDGGEKGPFWHETKSMLEKAQENTALTSISILEPQDDEVMRYYVASHQEHSFGLRQKRSQLPPEVQKVFATGMPQLTKLYNNKVNNPLGDGDPSISAYAPILDSSGKVVAVAGVDVAADKALSEAYGLGLRLAGGALFLLALLLTGVLIYNRKDLGAPLSILTNASRRLAAGQGDLPALPNQNNEFGLISQHLQQVSQSLDSLSHGMGKFSLRAFGRDPAGLAASPLSGSYFKVAEGVRIAMAIMDHFDAMVYIINPKNYQFLYFNRKMEQVYAFTPQHLESVCCFQMIGDRQNGPCTYCPLAHLFNQRASGNSPSRDWENFDRHSRSWLAYRASLIRWLDGSLVLACSARNIDSLKASEEKRQEQERLLEDAVRAANSANNMKSTFLANMSHGLRTPMNGIIGFSELAAADPELTPKSRNYIQKIQGCGQDLLLLLNDIFDIAKIESGQVAFESVSFSVPEVFKQCERVYSSRARDKGLQLFFSIEPFCEQIVKGDQDKLRQVLVILLENAVKFTLKGIIKVSCSLVSNDDSGLTFRFEVSDSGPGIPPERIKNIFDPYPGSSPAVKNPERPGSAIGLSIAKTFVEKMGGNIVVVSSLGIGSKFSFTLPFVLVPQENLNWDASLRARVVHSAPSGADDADKPHFQGEVLFCDDDEISIEVALEHFAALGLQPRVVYSGEDALREIEQRRKEERPFDLILLDIHMPLMTGTEVAQRLKEMGNSTPVVAVTSNASDADLKDYSRVGMNDCLVKPFKTTDLEACLSRYLQRDDGREA